MFLFRRPKNFLGIDIGASSIKLVELSRKDERYKLENYAIFSLKEYLSSGEHLMDSEGFKISNKELSEIIGKTIKEAGIKSRNVYFSVPVCLSFSTLIDFPDIPEKEIAAAIDFEAKKYIPVPMSEVILDWSIISSPRDNSKKQVLLIAVPKKVINNYSQIAKLLKLNLRLIEEESFSLIRALVGNDKSTILLIDAGARSINVIIIDKGYVRDIHNLEMGGDKISQMISQRMNLKLKEAEGLKRGLSDRKSDSKEVPQLRENIYSFLGNIIVETKKITDSYQQKYGSKIEKCILVGGGSALFGFNDYLANKLFLDVAVGDPFARVVYPDLLKPVLKDLSPSLSVAVGLAMR